MDSLVAVLFVLAAAAQRTGPKGDIRAAIFVGGQFSLLPDPPRFK